MQKTEAPSAEKGLDSLSVSDIINHQIKRDINIYHYQYCLNISYNEEGTPGLGSAIFLHCLAPAKPFTGGCVSIPEDHMKFVMQRVNQDTAVVIDTYESLSCGADWPASTWPQER